MTQPLFLLMAPRNPRILKPIKQDFGDTFDLRLMVIPTSQTTFQETTP